MARQGDSYQVSSKSRTKLNAFRYDDKDGESPEKSPSKTTMKKGNADKENQTSWLNGVVEEGQPGKEQGQSDKGQPSSQAKDTKPVKECPQTPGNNRLPLVELISNAEDAFSRAPKQVFTPEDHVIWQHVPASSNPDTMSQTPATRGKKRRHTSSPSSSPLAGNMDDFQTVLKTPQHDLATDLWNNYVGKSTLNGNPELPPPRFANLLSSSPQTPASAKAGRDSSGLRRSISCNAEWPASKVKRRRVGRGEPGTSRGIFSRTSSNLLDSGPSNSSRINFLLEKIKNTMQKDPTAQLEPSSPVPARTNVQMNQSPSPVKIADGTEKSDKQTQGGATIPEVSLQGSSSEFEDDDLDQDFMDFADASMDPFVEPTQPQDHQETGGSEFRSEVTSNDPQYSWGETNGTRSDTMASNSNKHTINKNDTNDTDEFGNDDDDFSDSLEEILAKCDGPGSRELGNPAQPPPATTMQSTGSHEGAKLSFEASSGDEFDDDDFDMEAIEQSMLQSGEDGSHHNLKNRQAIKRYQIVDTAENTYVTSKGRVQPEQILSVQDEKTKHKKVIVLRESWFDSPCSNGSYIHLIGDFDATGQCIVNDSENMIILHPDHLISATVVADSISCQRRAVLQDRIKNSNDVSRPQVFGIIFHEVFQEAMQANQWVLNSLRALVEKIMVRHVEDLYLVQMSIFEGVEYVMSKIPVLKTWADTFLRAEPTNESFVEDRNNSKLHLSINKLLEVEEHIWSPMYGLKGNIDATVQVACHDGESDKNLVIPLELKTGKRDTNQAHRAQTALYTLLLSDRYGKDNFLLQPTCQHVLLTFPRCRCYFRSALLS
ncbi:hypothetical protein ASPWEDRAFT_218869 [Aspergillus wentii DTO 134E9]|uniref:DNA replication factor Dna2 N-terminal domain-containing protein n=1 Tax=Aspergillus wentii DTO 134E9 TaxID=1073089 RepID=A0A1L9S019_ASPWE|nr:uncharacterized protein ASPWEDRAFT_218869 [Aspergillus wentii DTO 134E9]OJJ40513.1 hypothetical protein ASPWEDRAFT_218869 [Aspergillus wentii DTO 134E9]